MSGSRDFTFQEIGMAGAGAGDITRAVPLEVPVAFEFAGLAYAVMMATPTELEDFALGFALSEGLIGTPDELGEVTVAQIDGGVIVRADLPPTRAEPLRDRVRLRVTEGSCGLCGLQSIEDVLRPLPPLTARPLANREALIAALGALRKHQPLSRETGAVHAAAFADAEGTILAAREDVGRHNALDKLVGHCAQVGLDMEDGFVVLSARCSYELVEKTVRAGCPLLVTISAPTSLAVDRARSAGLTLVALARDDTALVAHDPHGLFA
ncbi:formate dehydrogenase accessory sulfurtransferase FdhD [Erythrobacter sp. LQ02-29]|uniref:formate dehydrogenase accessory sulfurtransferase FdhD n=1 Tax=Erythrobacter sp. LQ02-29 TaxID=2920384 RepID=UPI001F4E7CF9|nr:formate dehydrogenase accessory sulfurtransferase FdhD [Erythrobacter sp. LQ02-29]MCP9222094.1 formate dehydrogenase accessory sulfurtransferase FdhD [Erythrobacter sp. LQ02-29]